MKKIRIFLLILAAMFAVQMYEPVTSCDVYAAAKTTTKKSTAKKKTKKKKNGFYKESSKKYCYYKNGKKIKNQWKTVKGKKYYFGKDGYALRGRRLVKGVRYLFRKDGSLYTRKSAGFVTYRNEKYYLYKNGALRIGWFKVGRYTYYADKYGILKHDTTYAGLSFNSNGQTKANKAAQLKVTARNIINRVTNSKMSKGQKLRACYNYLAYGNHFYYYVWADPDLNADKWWIGCAQKMFDQSRGNCYGFACTFAALAKELGYKPYVICGRVPGSRDHAADGYTRHGWVMINGKHYDAEGAFAGWGGCFGTSDFTTAYQVQKIVQFKY